MIRLVLVIILIIGLHIALVFCAIYGEEQIHKDSGVILSFILSLPLWGLLAHLCKRVQRVKLAEFDEIREVESLRKHIKEPEFFRWRGPAPVDFDQGYVYPRPEVEECVTILQRKGQNGRLLITGLPAAGKSVLATQIGLKLQKERYHVIYRSFKERPIKRFTDLQMTMDRLSQTYKRTVVILDDVHLEADYAIRLVDKVDNKRIHFLLLGREKEEEAEPESGEELRKPGDLATKFHDCERKHLDAGPTFEETTKSYAKHKDGLNREVTDDEIQDLRRECGDDLLYLGRYLREWQDGTPISELRPRVHRSVLQHLDDLEERHGEDTPIIILALAHFFRYEIPVAKSFITDDDKGLGLSKDVLKELIDAKEIHAEKKSVGQEYMLSLYHSSVAKLVVESCKDIKWTQSLLHGLGGEIINIYHRYIQCCPLQSPDVIIKLWEPPIPEITVDLSGKRIDSVLLCIIHEILSSEDTYKSVLMGLRSELVGPKKLGDVIWAIRVPIPFELAKRVIRDLGDDLIENKITNTISPADIGSCLDDIHAVAPDTALRIASRCEEHLVTTICATPDFFDVSWCFAHLWEVDTALTKRIALRCENSIADAICNLTLSADALLSCAWFEDVDMQMTKRLAHRCIPQLRKSLPTLSKERPDIIRSLIETFQKIDPNLADEIKKVLPEEEQQDTGQ